VDLTICVATYGDPSWRALARERAIPSAESTGAHVVASHGGATIAEARNLALAEVTTEYVCFLDADDELEPGYVTAMAAATGDVRVPRVRYVGQVQKLPHFPRVAGHRHHHCEAACLTDGNWIVIGAAIRTDLLRSIGGHWDYPWSEDWSIWLRAHLTGATFARVRGAIYRAHARLDSRNRGAEQSLRIDTHHRILADCLAWAA
jgi:glycosyltransferase involved in cell wall biosynthesis